MQQEINNRLEENDSTIDITIVSECCQHVRQTPRQQNLQNFRLFIPTGSTAILCQHAGKETQNWLQCTSVLICTQQFCGRQIQQVTVP